MKIFLTGATGTMGFATLQALLRLSPLPVITLLLRDSKKNRKKIKPYDAHPHVRIIWGDLRDRQAVRKGVSNSEIVLHVGGMVSPKADYHPKDTLDVNINGMKNIVEAAAALPESRQPAVVYIGSVSQYGPREAPQHWCRTGDPMVPADHDMYALSKIKAECILAESGLKRWVSLRQTGILYPALLFNGTDPITFHVPLAGVLEWTTVEESANLLANLCRKYESHALPKTFWRRFYNIGSGELFRLTNYQFEQQLLKALSCPEPEKIFDTNWFATRNFHGAWFSDSDRLEEIIPFRIATTPEKYFRFMTSQLPAFFKLAGIVPPNLIKWGMKKIAMKKGLGTLGWFRDGNEEKIRSYFKSRKDYAEIPGWNEFPLTPPSHEDSHLSHGYDESKPLSDLTIEDMKEAAAFRGGKCLSEDMEPGDIYSPLDWECAFGHRFKATPATVLLGGHWCDECLSDSAAYPREATLNPFMAQAWLSTHGEDEMRAPTNPS
ncbi:MAG: NAD(P)-dependent oxidoreductase [Muribaculaceae bacterium]|nr:NAD(P)-dependent oxidoreductase [Muribaculaceae bacterium]